MVKLRIAGISINLVFLWQLSYAQLVVDQTYTPNQLVQNILLGSGVQAFNITYTGDVCMKGYFNAQNTLLGTNFGMNEGVILASGCISNAVGPNNGCCTTTAFWGPGDPDLTALAGYSTHDAAVLEFDFIPTGDTIKFDYIFGSEEYEEWVNSTFNDVFGFFLSGPGISGPFTGGAVNIALIPGTGTYVGINTVNYMSNTAYYYNNTCCTSSPCSGGVGSCSTNPQVIQYDGHTVKLTAIYPVICGDTYHIKLAVADAGDAAYDSGVFLKKGSFQTSGMGFTLQISSSDSVSLYEGCQGGTLYIYSMDTSVGGKIYISTYGQATEGVDINNLPDSVVINPGADTAAVLIQAFQDGVQEGNETLYVVIKYKFCNQWKYDTSMLVIKDSTDLMAVVADTTLNCGCATIPVTAQVSGGNLPYSYAWSDGNTATTLSSFTTTVCSSKNFYLTVTDGCGYKVYDTLSVSVGSATPLTITIPDTIGAQCGGGSTVILSVSSVNGGQPPYSYLWSNGATSPSTTISPPAVPTYYYVTVDDNCGTIPAVVDSILVVPSSSGPQASFTASNQCVYTPISFTNNSSNANSYGWYFGDGTSSSAINPQHSYSSAGIYNVTLVAYGSFGCTDTFTYTVSVYPQPLASFSNLSSLCDGTPVSFMNNSTGATSYLWDFGDGSTSNQTSPVHLYNSTGQYTVSLIATNNYGCNDTTFSIITVSPVPQASFTAQGQCVSIPVTFVNNSTGATSHQWYFGDGTSSSNTSPSHVYQNAGAYQVTLIAISSAGCQDTEIKMINIYPLPQPSFTTSNACAEDTAFFLNTSTISGGSIAQYIWGFGDGSTSTSVSPYHIYSQGGVYNVTLIAVSDSGCIAQYVAPVTIHYKPTASFNTSSKCMNEQPVVFNNTSSVINGVIAQSEWYFGDGSSTSIFNPSHYYSDTGLWSVTLIVTSNNGCRDTANGTVYIKPAPSVDFTSPDKEECPPACITLVNNSTAGASYASITSAYWSVNGESSMNMDSAVFCFTKSGLYDVSLIVTNSLGCSDTLVKPDYIFIYPVPDAFFVIEHTEIDILQPVINVYDASTGATSLQFYIDYDTLITAPSFPYTFNPEDTGKHTISLVVANTYGCVDSFSTDIYLKPLPFLYVPNAFTPNGDDINDTFIWKGFGIKEDMHYYFGIYDRWGTLIWESRKVGEGWDGNKQKSGEPAPEGVYVWKLQCADISGKLHKLTGHVVLLR